MPNVKEVTPMLSVTDMERSLRFYRDGLGFQMNHQWVVEGRIRWCWLTLGGASLMLQESPAASKPVGTVGEGVSLWFQCEDSLALYREFRSRDLDVSEPQVGNGLWDTRILDPDGYRLHFESATDVPEETRLSELTT